MEREPVATDPSARVCTYFEPLGEGAIRLVWHADQPESLLAELRGPKIRSRLNTDEVRQFWTAVKSKIADIGPLPIEAADPYP